MASVSRDGNGTKRVCFTDRDGKPRAIRLGKASSKAAEGFCVRVEALLADKLLARAHDAELCAWLRDLPERVYAKLVRAGLVEARATVEVVTVGALLDRFEKGAVVKAGTHTTYLQATAMLREHLGAATPVGEVTPAHADDWRKAIAGAEAGKKALAPATVAKRVRVAKAVFRKAVKWGLIPSNPFADLRAGSMANPDRAFYVTRGAIAAILAACPDDQWRAIVALSRYAGLRCPSEVAGLKWGDVNWERGRLTVRSPKTAGHEGHAVRIVPIAPELRPILLALFEQAEPGSEAIVPRVSDPAVNLRTTFGKIIARAGEKPWPRLFHNMRASCATDWVERFPAHAVAAWLGHSPLIAAQHYLQIRDAHFDMATGVEPGGAQSGAPAARKAAQHPTAAVRAGSRESSDAPCFVGTSGAGATPCEAAAAGRETGGKWTNDPNVMQAY